MKNKKISKKNLLKNNQIKNEIGRKSKINRRKINGHISHKKTMKGGYPPRYNKLSETFLSIFFV